jgi:hypothetical protein
MTPIILAVLLAAAATDAGAGPPTTVAPATVTSTKPQVAADKPVCRSEEEVGSRVRTRKCMTQAQWDQQDEQVRQYFQDVSDHGAVNRATNNPMQPH